MKLFEDLFDGNIQPVREYLAQGDVNIKNEKGQSLLHCAIILANNEVFNLLLKAFIDINAVDNYGDTPLHYCINYNRMGYLKTLLRENAQIKRNNFGETPIYRAALLKREEMIYLFCETMQINLLEVNDKNESLFNALIKGRCTNILKEIKPIKELASHLDYEKNNSLHIACETDDEEIIQYILNTGIWPNHKNTYGQTPLHIACMNASRNALKLLIEAGANIDILDNQKNACDYYIRENAFRNYFDNIISSSKIFDYMQKFPLHYYVICEKVLKVRMLMNPLILDRKDNYGYTAYDYALMVNNEEIIKLFPKKGKK